MKKILLSTLIMLISILPARAYENQYGLRSSLNAGFRLTIPFGATKQREAKIKYGLQMGFRRELDNRNGFRNDGHMTERQIYNADIISLNFSENGFKNLSFAGRETFIYKDGAFKAAWAAEDGQGGSGVTKGILIGAGIVIVTVGVAIGVLVLTVPSD